MKKMIGAAALLLAVFLGGCGELWSEPVGTMAATAAENGDGAAEYEITEMDFRTEARKWISGRRLLMRSG